MLYYIILYRVSNMKTTVLNNFVPFCHFLQIFLPLLPISYNFSSYTKYCHFLPFSSHLLHIFAILLLFFFTIFYHFVLLITISYNFLPFLIFFLIFLNHFLPFKHYFYQFFFSLIFFYVKKILSKNIKKNSVKIL